MYLSFVVFILYMSLCKLIVEEGGSSLNELVKMNCVGDITKCGVIVLLKNNDTGGTLGMHAWLVPGCYMQKCFINFTLKR